MNQEWSDPKLVDNYSTTNDDQKNNWYEREINVPSIMSLLPEGRIRVLDFGCGPGDLTTELVDHGFEAEGADESEGMIKKAQEKHDAIPFFVWNGLNELTGYPKFDAIVTKLTLEFVTDLGSVLENLKGALVSDGCLVASVMHPILAVSANNTTDYWDDKPAHMQIGTTGLFVTKLQRTIAAYINTFIEHGFTLERIEEPSVPPEIIQKYGLEAVGVAVPKRLNVRFRNAGTIAKI